MSQEYRPIEKRFLDSNQRMGTLWDEGLVFFRVLVMRDTLWAPFSENFEQISVGGSTGMTELKDASNNEILEIPEKNAKVLVHHVGIGFNRDLWCYPEYPGGKRLGRFRKVDPPRTGDIHTYIPGDHSPYEQPTERMEFLFPFGMDLMLDFYNPGTGNREVQPILNILMRKYIVEVLDPHDAYDAIIIGAMARDQRAWRPFPMGPVDDLSSYDTLKKFWKVEPIDLRAARKLGTTQRRV